MKEKKKDKNHGSPASPVDHILFSDRLRFGDLKYSSAYSLSIGSGTLNHTMFILRKIICALAATRLSAALELVEATTTSVSLPTASESPSEPPPASDSPYSPGSNSSIASISFSGNGCPQNGGGVGRFANYTGNLVDGQEIVYHNFTAVQQGAAFPPTGRTLNCQMHLSVTGGDMGWQVSPDVVSYGGFAVLDPESAVSFFVTTFWSQDASYTVGIGQFNSPPFSSHLSCPTTDANPPSQQKKKKTVHVPDDPLQPRRHQGVALRRHQRAQRGLVALRHQRRRRRGHLQHELSRLHRGRRRHRAGVLWSARAHGARGGIGQGADHVQVASLPAVRTRGSGDICAWHERFLQIADVCLALDKLTMGFR